MRHAEIAEKSPSLTPTGKSLAQAMVGQFLVVLRGGGPNPLAPGEGHAVKESTSGER
jgi:hypothetical protein